MTGDQDLGREFHCSECGRHIVSFGPALYGDMCCMCIHLPGWHDDDRLRAVLEPDDSDETIEPREAGGDGGA